MPNPAWAFITDNEVFSRSRFRGVTWSKLASNSQSFDWSRRRSLVDVWTFVPVQPTTPVETFGKFCEDDPVPFVTNVYTCPRTTALHIQTTYIVNGVSLKVALAQKIGVRELRPEGGGADPFVGRWDLFPMPAAREGRPVDQYARGTNDASWQLSDMEQEDVVPPERPGQGGNGRWDRQALAIRFMPFDVARRDRPDPRRFDAFGGRQDGHWQSAQMDAQVVTINGDNHVLGHLGQRRTDLGTDLQIKIMKRIRYIAKGLMHAEAFLVGVKIHGLREED